jgi:hypothetical protein
MALVEEGTGNPNIRYLEEIKSRRRKSRKNNTFLRMYLFLDPYTTVIIKNWK